MLVQNNENPYQKVLNIRQDYLNINANAFKGNSKSRTNYLNQLESLKPNLTPFQMSYLVGLILSDASMDFNDNQQTARIKLQQGVDHLEWVKFINKVFLEYSPSNNQFSNPSKSRSNMISWSSLKCKTFYDATKSLLYCNNKKTILPALEKWINPISMSAWICGDGSTLNTNKQGGKGICLHSQGFSDEENQKLVEMINKKLNFNARTKKKLNEKNSFIVISGKSYDSLVTTVGPYIHPDFFHRIPEGRLEKSRFGFVTETLRQEILGKELKNLENLICNYEPN